MCVLYVLLRISSTRDARSIRLIRLYMKKKNTTSLSQMKCIASMCFFFFKQAWEHTP